jgi:hypothetical protein
MHKFSARIKSFLFQSVQAQLILTLISIPILVCWGLPISALTFVGNLIFNQFLGIFLILSSLIFFLELFGIPNSFLITCLEKFTQFWQKLLSLGQQSWLIGFSKTNVLILLSIPIATYLILKHKKVNTLKKRILAMTIILLCYSIFLNFLNQQNFGGSQTFESFKNKLDITQDKDGKLDLQDNGFFCKKRSVRNFLEFDLRPYILKKFGSKKIKNFTILKPGISSFRAAQELCNIFEVEQITLPIFDKKLDKKAWREFFKLRDLLKEKGIKFVRGKKDMLDRKK